MKNPDLEKFNQLYEKLNFDFTSEEVLTIYTAKNILQTRVLGENPTESLAAEICLRAMEIMLDVLTKE